MEAPAPEAALAVDPADSDEQLMERYRDGDDAAFERLYSRHRGPLYRYFLRQCGGEATAEELFQDVWLKLIKARGRYRVTARFTTYLYQMAHRRLIDHYRRTKVRVALESYGDDAEVAAFPMAAHEQPEQREERRRQTETLLALLATLPAAQREAFLLKAEAGLSLAEIAVVTGTTRETVKSRLRYAVAKLRRGMGALI
ncbi:MAG: RNA polymerase sigma factor [Candidatus Competibacterales bacterium]